MEEKVSRKRLVKTRQQQVEDKLNASREELIAANCCLGCSLLHRYCICSAIEAATSLHHVTTLLHAVEAYRSTSTHKLLLLGLKHSDAKIVDSIADGSVAAIVAGVRESVAASGRTPVLLYPSERAGTVRSLYTELSPEQRSMGLHALVLDGTWSNVRAIYKSLCEVMPDLRHVVVEPEHECSLFQPLRAQPAPGRISTVEAVACVFDEWYSARAAERGLIGGSASCSAAAASSSLYRHMPPVHEVVLRCPSYIGRHLRYALCMLVDRVCRQTGFIGTGRGSGYRTWLLSSSSSSSSSSPLSSAGSSSAACNSAAGNLLQLPAWIIEHIATFAYGRDNCMESGYLLRHTASERDWREVIAKSAGEAPAAASNHPLFTKAALGRPVVAASSTADISSTLASAAASPRVSVFDRRMAQGGLPRPTEPYARMPLALVNRALYCFACGFWDVREFAKHEGVSNKEFTVSSKAAVSDEAAAARDDDR
jgi:DTW domain-containing protein YfiP